MFSLQLLIFYLINDNYQSDCSIKKIIEDKENYINIGEECKDFFKNNPDFKLNTLISIFEFIELLCYPQILENVNEEYKIDIQQEEINKINQYFNNNHEILISKMLILPAVRKFISRFLSGKREEKEIKESENLLYFLRSKEDFWPKDIFHNPKFDVEFENMLNSFSINVNKAINFYEVLGGNKLEMENEDNLFNE